MEAGGGMEVTGCGGAGLAWATGAGTGCAGGPPAAVAAAGSGATSLASISPRSSRPSGNNGLRFFRLFRRGFQLLLRTERSRLRSQKRKTNQSVRQPVSPPFEFDRPSRAAFLPHSARRHCRSSARTTNKNKKALRKKITTWDGSSKKTIFRKILADKEEENKRGIRWRLGGAARVHAPNGVEEKWRMDGLDRRRRHGLLLPQVLLVSAARNATLAAKWKLTLELCSCGTRLAREGQR
jgi:hypothetical protein